LLCALGCLTTTRSQHIRREEPSTASLPEASLLSAGSGHAEVTLDSHANGYIPATVGDSPAIAKFKAMLKHQLSEETKAKARAQAHDDIERERSSHPSHDLQKDAAVSTPAAPEAAPAAPASFIQLAHTQPDAALQEAEKQTTVELAQSATPVATETKKKGDVALAEAESQTIVMYTLGEKSPESKALDELNRQRIERSRKWRDEANPVDDYEEAAGSVSFSQVSKKRSGKAKAYDGMQAKGSGFWAEDRPDEKRVDLSDHKIYTWAQYRAKHLAQHSWTVEVAFKKLPTLKRVKKLGKRAFIQRFR